ncbi:MAG: general secretion pathway protein F [Parcubacteria bacterium C7867-003]|nr:MAG: general secretion pathway protein F [Parcubacteria bacterium C7867-003]
MLFHYKILNKDGKVVEGDLESKDKFALYHTLKQDGSTVISAEEVRGKREFTIPILSAIFEGVKTRDKIVFAKNLAKMTEAGLPITRALSILERQSKGAFRKVLVQLGESLNKGETLSDAMKSHPKVFSTLFVSMVKAGEESGNISMALQNVGMQMEKSYLLTKKIRGAMMYPTVIILLMIIIGVLMMVYMVPTLTATFVGLGVKLPLSTRMIIWVSDFLKSYFIFVILGSFISALLLVLGYRTKRGQRISDYIFLHLPVIKEIVKQINSARTARTLSSLLSSGVDIVLAIGITKDVIQNSYYKTVLQKIQDVIQKGEPISGVFNDNGHLYPLFVGEMVAVGEETGKIGEMLLGVATFYEEEVDQKTKDMSSIIEPILMIFIGGAVGFFALSMLGPTYSLADAL